MTRIRSVAESMLRKGNRAGGKRQRNRRKLEKREVGEGKKKTKCNRQEKRILDKIKKKKVKLKRRGRID